MTGSSPQVSKNLEKRMNPFVMASIEEWTKTTDSRISFGGLVAKSFIVKRLRTFPEVAQRLMGILENADFKMSEIEGLIKQDPALMASVIRLANSALFSGSRRVEKIETAFMRLGREKVAEIVASVATMGLFEEASPAGLVIRDHSSATAAIAQELSRDLAPSMTDGVYLAGLMHDLGKLLMESIGEELYGRIDVKELMRPDNVHLLERDRLGYDHAMLAGQVLSLWSFPTPVPQVVAWHHVPSLAYQYDDIGKRVALLRSADRIEHALANLDDQSKLQAPAPDPNDEEAVAKERAKSTRVFLEELWRHMAAPEEVSGAEEEAQEEEMEELLDRMCRSLDFEVAGITREYIEAKWDALADVREESLSVFY